MLKLYMKMTHFYSFLSITTNYVNCQDVYVIGRVPGYVSISDIMDSGDNVIRSPCIKSREELAFLPYSSGTTGKPKGVMLSHHNINAMVVAVGSVCCDVYILFEAKPLS